MAAEGTSSPREEEELAERGEQEQERKTEVEEDLPVVSPELRAAHQKAFDEAVTVITGELDRDRTPGQTVALLTGVQNVFEAWAEGEVDGPMPPLTTPELLRSKVRYVVVGEAAYTRASNYIANTERVFERHMGGGTSLSPKLLKLFHQGIQRVRSSLRSGAREDALCEAIKLTKAMVVHDDWWCDTDMPDQVALLVTSLAYMWRGVLASLAEAEERDVRSLVAWLEDARTTWEMEAAEHIGLKLAFDFHAPAGVTTTPRKAGPRRLAAVTPEPAPPQPGAKKRKPSDALAAQPTKRAKVAPASAETEAWLHRLDGELKERQASAVQLRCEAEGGGKKRVLVVSGAYPLKAVGRTIAEAFGVGVGSFDPHQNKGTTPPGMRFCLRRDGDMQALRPMLKIVQAVQAPGDVAVFGMDGLVVNITLDAIKLKSDNGFNHIKERPMPRCVGGDKGLGPQLLKRLNRAFFHNRKPMDFIGCSKSQKIAATLEHMARPLALKQGEPVVEGIPEEVFGHLLCPLVI